MHYRCHISRNGSGMTKAFAHFAIAAYTSVVISVHTHTKHLDTILLPMYERRLCRQLNRGGFCIQVKSESAAEQIFLRKTVNRKMLNF